MGDQMTKFVSLHNNLHRHIRVDQSRIEAQGAKERMVPVVMSEFLKLAVQYPIAFTKYSDTGRFVCVALLGFEEHENLFWDGERWQGIYTPLNIVRQPFFVGQEDDKTVICIDAESDCLTREAGQAIFTEQGEETALDQRGSAARDCRPAERDQSDEGDRSIANEIERVGLERLRSREEAAGQFDHAEAEVEKDNNPERAPIGGVDARTLFVRFTAAIAHSDTFPFASRRSICTL